VSHQRLAGLPRRVGVGTSVGLAAVGLKPGQVKVANSEHAAFASDSVLLRATWRFGHVVVRPNRIGVFTIGGGGS
jgi:hypothetical protein